MAELLFAIAIALGVRALLGDRSPRAAAGSLAHASRADAPVNKTLRILGTEPALLTRQELRQHALPFAEVADACFVAGPGALCELPEPAQQCLLHAQRTGQVRGPLVAQLAGGSRELEAGQALIFVLLDNAAQGPRVHAYVSSIPEKP